MGRGRLAACLLLCACKAELGGDQTTDASNQPDSSTVTDDAGADAPIMLGPWGTATAIPGANTAAGEDDCTLSSTALELYFKRNDSGDANLYVMTRATTSDSFGSPVALTTLNSTATEESPRLSFDDLTLYFGRGGDIYQSLRTAVGQPWGAPTLVTSLNTGAYEKWAAVCPGGYTIVSRDNGGNGQDLFEGTINGGAATALTAFNTTSAEQGTFLSSDCLRVYFQSNRDNAQFDIYVASRLTTTAAWSNPTKLADFNTTTFAEEDPWISPDQRTFVYASDANGNKDLFISTR